MQPNDLSAVSGRMEGLRRRVRRLFLVSGLSRVLLAATLLLLLSFALDVALKLPIGVRIASGLLAAGAIVVVAIRAIAYPLSVRIPDEDLALAAEARLPDLKDRLISALQFRRQIEDPENSESGEMMRAVMDEAASLERAIEARTLTDTRVVRRHGLFAAGAVGAFLLAILLFPSAASVWARRNLLLMDIPWPQSTTLTVRGFPESGEMVVTRGETVRVEAVAEGRVPSDVRIVYERLDGEGGPLQRPMFQDEAARGVFRFEFRQVPESFRFWVIGGDDTDREPVYTVVALVPPTIESIAAACVFPAYTGLPGKTLTEGDMDLPEGTQVDLAITANMPLREMTIVRDEDPAEAVALDADGRVGRIRFVAARTFDYEIRMAGADGQRSLPGSGRFRVRAVADRKPQARILFPTERESLTERASVPVKMLASDNYGVARITLHYRVGPDGEYAVRPFAPEEIQSVDASREVLAYRMFRLSEFGAPGVPVKVGDEISWFVEAEDNNGNTDRSGRYRIEVVTNESLERRLAQRQALLREDALDTGKDQGAALRQTADLVEFLSSGDALETRDRERIRDDQVLQNKVTRDADRFFGAVSRVFLTYVMNRLSTPLATERILGFVDDFLRADRKAASEVFKPELFRLIVDDYREGNIVDQEVLAVLIEIIEISMKISAEDSPAAHDLLKGLARGESAGDARTVLEQVRGLQQGIVEMFQTLDRKMQRWESYAEIIQLARDLKDLQRDIRQGTDGVRKGN